MSSAPALKSRLPYRLKIISGPHQNEVHTLDKDVIKLGRGDDNTIQLPRDGRISRHHVEIYWNGFEYRVKNLSQKNFVMVNEKVVQDEVLKPGSKVQLGETLIEIFEDGPILVPQNKTSALQPTPKVPTKAAASNSPLRAVPNAMPTPRPASRAKPGVKPRPARGPNLKYKQSGSNSRLRFYLIVGVVIGLVLWLGSQGKKKSEKLTFRSSQQIEYDRLQTEANKEKLEERINAQNNPLMRQVQENLVKGFRDYQQGNYMRAKENFASVLVKDPDNELAKRYYNLSSIKFDELLQFYILQGLRYREKKNYRLCRSSFRDALVMIQNNKRHPKYNEIKDYFDECNLAIEGRF